MKQGQLLLLLLLLYKTVLLHYYYFNNINILFLSFCVIIFVFFLSQVQVVIDILVVTSSHKWIETECLS
jgi:hypothetical protein